MAEHLTKLESSVYHYLLDFTAKNTYQPSIREIGELVGASGAAESGVGAGTLVVGGGLAGEQRPDGVDHAPSIRPLRARPSAPR